MGIADTALKSARLPWPIVRVVHAMNTKKDSVIARRCISEAKASIRPSYMVSCLKTKGPDHLCGHKDCQGSYLP
eukprot:14913450-Ditylum_brightwellii.AAC.1